MDENEMHKKSTSHEIGMSLETISVDELVERIEILRLEIDRLNAEIAKKTASRSVAENVFK